MLTALEIATERFSQGYRPKKLLTKNTKLAKGDIPILGLQLAPADASGYEVCPARSPLCTSYCLFSAGRGAMMNVQWPRILKTLWYFQDRKSFMIKLMEEIDQNRDAAIRLNVLSDIVWERKHPEIFEEFSDVQFYDYTKIHQRFFKLKARPDNYHLTFSLNELNEQWARLVLEGGDNVSFIGDVVPDWGVGYNVVDGDEDDARFLDPSPSLVRLVPKGKAKQILKEVA